MPGGRPPKLTKAQREEVLTAFAEYIEGEKDPTIVGFCAENPTALKYWINKDNIHDWEEFAELRKRAIGKQESYLLRGATRNSLNPTVAIFRLKQPQHGYTDKQQTDLTSDGKPIGPVLVKFIGGKSEE